MKKIFVLSLMFLTTGAFADAVIVNNFNGVCGNYGYDRLFASFTPISYTCSSGQFLPANAIACASCPNGFSCSGGTFAFNATQSQGLTRTATYITGTEVGVCASNYLHKIYADFTPNSYTCNNGYYLPADALGCAACPSGYACDGGTYAYNATKDQGLIQTATCSSGQFLPANTVVCASCPSEYTCSGGTYRFNERLAQGLVRNSDTITASANSVCAANFPTSLNASFTPNTINITWQNDTGTTITTNTCTYGGAITIPEAPHKTGYKFTGWTVVN